MKVEHITERQVDQICKEKARIAEDRLNKRIDKLRTENNQLTSEMMVIARHVEVLELQLLRMDSALKTLSERRDLKNGETINGDSTEKRDR